MNQLEVADQLKITAGAYAKIERCETDPSITRMFEIASILKTDPVNLIQERISEKSESVTKQEFYKFQSQVEEINKIVNKLEVFGSIRKKRKTITTHSR